MMEYLQQGTTLWCSFIQPWNILMHMLKELRLEHILLLHLIFDCLDILGVRRFDKIYLKVMEHILLPHHFPIHSNKKLILNLEYNYHLHRYIIHLDKLMMQQNLEYLKHNFQIHHLYILFHKIQALMKQHSFQIRQNQILKDMMELKVFKLVQVKHFNVKMGQMNYMN